ncbi:hypothetical protein SHO565_51780 [Streptomyces sp. HO565]
MVAESRTKGVGKSGGRLARRKTALERAAERVAEQRQAAAEAEAERLRREAAFDELVADFELAVEDEQAVVAAVEEEVRRVRERGRVRVAEARAVAARIVVAMGDAGESVAGCGRRLGVTVERVRELRRPGSRRARRRPERARLRAWGGRRPERTRAPVRRSRRSGRRGRRRPGGRQVRAVGRGGLVGARADRWAEYGCPLPRRTLRRRGRLLPRWPLPRRGQARRRGPGRLGVRARRVRWAG